MNNDCIKLYQISLENIPLNSWMINEYFIFQIVLVINGGYNLAISPEIIYQASSALSRSEQISNHASQVCCDPSW